MPPFLGHISMSFGSFSPCHSNLQSQNLLALPAGHRTRSASGMKHHAPCQKLGTLNPAPAVGISIDGDAPNPRTTAFGATNFRTSRGTPSMDKPIYALAEDTRGARWANPGQCQKHPEGLHVRCVWLQPFDFGIPSPLRLLRFENEAT